MSRGERTCVGCRSTDDPAHMLHLAVRDSVIVVNDTGREPGRGAWIHPSQACVDRAERTRAWARAFRHAGPLDASAIHGRLTPAV